MRVDTTEYLKNKVNPGTVDVFCGAQTQSINSQASSTPSSNTVSGPMERSFYLGGKRICSSTTRKKQELEETEHLRRPGAAFEQADECQTRKDPRVKDFAWTAMSTALADIQFVRPKIVRCCQRLTVARHPEKVERRETRHSGDNPARSYSLRRSMWTIKHRSQPLRSSQYCRKASRLRSRQNRLDGHRIG